MAGQRERSILITGRQTPDFVLSQIPEEKITESQILSYSMLKNFWGALKPEEQFTENFRVDQFRCRRSSLSQGQAVIPPDEVGYLFYLKKCTLVAEVVFPAGPPQKPGVENGEATAAATFVCQK